MVLELTLTEIAARCEAGELTRTDIARMMELVKTLPKNQHEVVRLRYLSGLETVEIAATLDISERTAHRDWLYGKAYLRDALASLPGTPPSAAGGERGRIDI